MAGAVLGRFSPQAFALFRIVTGLLFFMHGTAKLLGWPPTGHPMPSPLPPIVLAAGIIEVVCGLAITIGLFASIAAFIASGQMAVAYFAAHFKPTATGWIPLANQGEPAVFFCFAFLFIAAYGAGIWSIDNARQRVS